MAYTEAQLIEIQRMAHLLAQQTSHTEIRIREMASQCRVVERLCVAIRKGARNSALHQAFHTLDKHMIKAVMFYTMKNNEGPPPGWT